jgi:hypothetical protein
MAVPSDLEILNRVLRELSGSFLQYVGECWPWTSAGPDGAKQRESVMRCVERQRQSIAMLADYLTPRQARVELGPYSTDFTDLHYVSLSFLQKKLIQTQKMTVELIDQQIMRLVDAEAQAVLESVRRNEQENLAALQAP